MASGDSFYITTPIFYVNDVPHIGHAYTEVAADVLARWHRQRGDDTWLLTGTDEHGQKILRTAVANDSTPQAWVDRLVDTAWKPLLDLIDISNDDFIRTTDARHESAVTTFLQKLYDDGWIYSGDYEGYYCVGCEEYKQLDDLMETKDGDYAGQLVCKIHGRPIELLKETNYFFRMSAFEQQLLDLYERPGFIEPASVRNEITQFVKQGLADLSITRSGFDWGIQVPWDTSHVVYVWFDALLNYITAVGYGADDEQFARRWPAHHIVGKDIARFHAVIWPAMLMAAGLEVPHRVFGHGWLLVGGEKMSKSKLTGIAPSEITDTFGSDAFRYYFMRAIAFGQDGSFSWEDFSARYTSELANDYGNLASRVAAMVNKYFGGELPAATADGDAEQAIHDGLAKAVAEADRKIGEELDFQGGILAVFDFVKQVNGYITEQEPWKVAKDESPEGKARLATILYTAAEALRAVAVLLNPIMPDTSQKLWDSLGAEPYLGGLADQKVQDAADWGRLPSGATVTKGAVLFPRLEEKPTA